MELEQARARVEELRRIIDRNNRLYYDQDAPELEDYQYDALVRELSQLEEQFPQLVTANSPHSACGRHRQQQVQQGAPRGQDGEPAGCLLL